MIHNAQIVGFAEGTFVLMASGDWKSIEKVQEGDMVMSFDPAHEDSKLEPRKVVNTWSGVHRDCIEIRHNDRVTIAAKDQMFFTPGAAWLQSINTGQVIDYSGKRLPISTKTIKSGKYKIYDITVDKTHAFVANAMRVHNRTKPSTVVIAGKPGMPVSVTTQSSGDNLTVVVSPGAEQSAQITVNNNGSMTVKQMPTPNAAIIDPIRTLPYPSYPRADLRLDDVERLRDDVCSDILNRGDGYRITQFDENKWDGQLDLVIEFLRKLKKDAAPNYRPSSSGDSHELWKDPTTIHDAIEEVKDLKKYIKQGRKLDYSRARKECNKIENLLTRLRRQVNNGRNDRPNEIVVVNVGPSIPQSPAPENYFNDRIYENNGNYGYFVPISSNTGYTPIKSNPIGGSGLTIFGTNPDGSGYSRPGNSKPGAFTKGMPGTPSYRPVGDDNAHVFNPPNKVNPGGQGAKYYEHYDPIRKQNYFDRNPNKAIPPKKTR